MKNFVARLLQNPAKAQPSPSMYNATGYYNWFDGFHRSTDRKVYLSLLLLILKKPWNPAYRKLGVRYIWRRWVHRRCDTTDFHHDIYCDLDPWVKKRELERQYVEAWKGHYPRQEYEGNWKEETYEDHK